VSFQITVLKVLAGSPGRIERRLSLRVRPASTFSAGLSFTGWHITAAGREFLALVAKPASPVAKAVETVPAVVDPPPALVGVNTRRQRRRAGRSAA
jgi:hypothetical protein